MDPLDLRLDENPPNLDGTGRFLVRQLQELKVWGQRLLANLARRWTPRSETSATIYCQPWDHVRVGADVTTIRLPDPESCPGATIVLTAETEFAASVVSTGGYHVDGESSLLLSPGWAWIDFTSYGAPVVTASGVRGGWRSRRAENVATRLVDGILVSELGDTGVTTDASTWTTILTVPAVVGLSGKFCYIDGHVLCDSYDPPAPAWAAQYTIITRSTGLEYLHIAVSGVTLGTTFRGLASGNDLLIQVKGPEAATHTWIARATVDVRA